MKLLGAEESEQVEDKAKGGIDSVTKKLPSRCKSDPRATKTWLVPMAGNTWNHLETAGITWKHLESPGNSWLFPTAEAAFATHQNSSDCDDQLAMDRVSE